MKRSLLTVVLVLAALMIAMTAIPVYAEYMPEAPGYPSSIPWWEVCPPKVHTRTRVVTRTAETMIESIDAEGYCYTAIKRVNVRSQPSIYATKVQTIRSAGTEFKVSARVKNSSGELWYAVLLANGTLGYIRSDLLNTDHVILLGDPYAYEEEEENPEQEFLEGRLIVLVVAALHGFLANLFERFVANLQTVGIEQAFVEADKG